MLNQGNSLFEMNYNKKYNQLIEKARLENRSKNQDIYYENHHIIPKCMDGSDNKYNLILLTAKEHFVAHHLLTKIHGGKMWTAFWMMCTIRTEQRNYKVTASVYENAKCFMSKRKRSQTPWIKGRNHSEESKRKLSKSLKGNKNCLGMKHTKETKKKLSKAGKGRIPWNKGKMISEETRQKMSISMKGIIPWNKGKTDCYSKETKKKMGEANLGKKHP